MSIEFIEWKITLSGQGKQVFCEKRMRTSEKIDCAGFAVGEGNGRCADGNREGLENSVMGLSAVFSQAASTIHDNQLVPLSFERASFCAAGHRFRRKNPLNMHSKSRKYRHTMLEYAIKWKRERIAA